MEPGFFGFNLKVSEAINDISELETSPWLAADS
jgi:hypothetical protein